MSSYAHVSLVLFLNGRAAHRASSGRTARMTARSALVRTLAVHIGPSGPRRFTVSICLGCYSSLPQSMQGAFACRLTWVHCLSALRVIDSAVA
jgi:hypothetical protein